MRSNERAHRRRSGLRTIRANGSCTVSSEERTDTRSHCDRQTQTDKSRQRFDNSVTSSVGERDRPQAAPSRSRDSKSRHVRATSRHPRRASTRGSRRPDIPSRCSSRARRTARVHADRTPARFRNESRARGFAAAPRRPRADPSRCSTRGHMRRAQGARACFESLDVRQLHPSQRRRREEHHAAVLRGRCHTLVCCATASSRNSSGTSS